VRDSAGEAAEFLLSGEERGKIIQKPLAFLKMLLSTELSTKKHNDRKEQTVSERVSEQIEIKCWKPLVINIIRNKKASDRFNFQRLFLIL
jgi:menaquinone-dependent protoporphyrinogen IX oxidase